MKYKNADPARIRHRRIAKGLTQAALARKAGISKQHVNSVENGRYDFSPEVLKSVAGALECSTEDLMPDDVKASA